MMSCGSFLDGCGRIIREKSDSMSSAFFVFELSVADHRHQSEARWALRSKVYCVTLIHK